MSLLRRVLSRHMYAIGVFVPCFVALPLSGDAQPDGDMLAPLRVSQFQMDFTSGPPPIDLSPPPPPSVRDGSMGGARPTRPGRGRPAQISDCGPDEACFRPNFGQLPLPQLGSGVPPLPMGVEQDLASQALRNGTQIEQMVNPEKGGDDDVGSSRIDVMPVNTGLGPCGNGRDLRDLLTPGCIAAMRPLTPGMAAFPSLTTPPSPPVAVQTGFSCNVAIFPMGESGQTAGHSSLSFLVPNLVQCIQAGVRLGQGVAGHVNIHFSSPSGQSVGVSCIRLPESLSRVTCAAQP